MGVTRVDGHGTGVPFAYLADGGCDGVRAHRAIGTYLHGAFEDARLCAEIFGASVPEPPSRADQYQQLGAWFATHARHVEQLGLV
jgi:hypothetical protein